MADDMDWKSDTPPKILYKSSKPFSQSLRKRTLDEYAEDQPLEISRSERSIPNSFNPHPAYSRSSAGQGLTSIVSHYSILPSSSQVYATSPHLQYHTDTTTTPTSYRQWLASRRALYGEHGKAWRYLCQSIDTIGYSIAAVLYSETLRSICFTGFQAGQYLFTKNRRITKSYAAVIRTANDAKRRIVEVTRHYGPPRSAERILLSPDQRRLLRYREKIRSCAKGQDHLFTYNNMDKIAGTAIDSPNPLGYYMSGGLQPIETPIKGLRMPGTWFTSPRYAHQTPRSLYAYEPNSINETNSPPDGAIANDDSIVKNMSLTDPCADCETTNNVGSVHNATESATADGTTVANHQSKLVSVTSKTEKPDQGEIAQMEGKVTENENDNTSTLSPQTVMAQPTETCNDAQLSPASAQCVNATGYIDPEAREIQRIYDRCCKGGANPTTIGRYPRQRKGPIRFHPFERVLRAPLRNGKALAAKTNSLPARIEFSPTDLNLLRAQINTPETPQSQPSPTAPWYQIEVSDSPAWSYGKGTSQILSSPPISFTPTCAAGANSPKKRVTFYRSPKTGQPVSRFKKYIKGSRPKDAYNSSPSENSFAVTDDSSFSIHEDNNASVASSPTMQEQLGSPMQGVELSGASANLSDSTAPENNADSKKLQTPSPSDQLLKTEAGSATSNSPPIQRSPGPILRQVINGRTSRPEASTFVVTANGSPMHIHSSSLSSPIFESLSDENIPSLLRAEAISHSSGSLPINQNVTSLSVEQTDDASPLMPSAAVETTVHLNGAYQPSESSNAIPDGNMSSNNEESNLSSGPNDVSIQSSNAPSQNGEVQVQGDGFSFSEERSSAASDISSLAFNNNGSSPSDPSDTSVPSSTARTSPPSQSQANSYSATEDNSDGNSSGTFSSNEDGSITSAQGDSPVQSPPLFSTAAETHNADSSRLSQDKNQISNNSSPYQDSNHPPPSQGVSVDRFTVEPVSVDPIKADPVTADPVKAADPVTPQRVAIQFAALSVSARKHNLRSSSKAESDARRRAREEARIAAEKAQKEKEEAEEKARKAKEAKEARLKSGARRLPIGPVIEPLPAEWELKVNQALAENAGKTVASSTAGVNITRRDIGKVLPQPRTGDDPAGWLNDEVVAAYLQIVVQHGLKAAGHKRGETPLMHAFNTFFYKNLSEKAYQGVERWAKKAKIGGADLLKVERVFIPINMNSSHWTLLVVSPKFRTIEYFDSFHGRPEKQIQNARVWLKGELKDLYKEEEWKTIGRAGPKQDNGSDCGVFVSTTAKMIMLGVDPMAYSASDIPVQRRRIVAELMNCGFEGSLAPKVVFPDDE